MACISFQSLAGAIAKDDGQPAKKRADVEARTRADVETGKRDPNANPGERPQRAEGQNGEANRQRLNRDPVKMASLMMQKFDKDSDEKLNVEELTAMMKFMQERRGQQGDGAGKGDIAGKEGSAGKKDRQRPGAEKSSAKKSVEVNEVGGVTPRRPPAE